MVNLTWEDIGEHIDKGDLKEWLKEERAKDKARQLSEDADTPQTDCETCRHYKLACELFSEICKYEPITQTETQNSNLTFETDTPQTESTGSPIGDYRDGVGAWQTDRMTEEEFDTMIAKGLLGQTDCNDRYAVRTDSGEVVAYACPLGCEQTDCPWK